MFKLALITLAGILAGASAPAMASTGYTCQAPSMEYAPSSNDGTTKFTILCQGNNINGKGVVSPLVTVFGEFNAQNSAPYLIRASYSIDPRDITPNIEPGTPKTVLATGDISLGINSIAQLSQSLSKHFEWDPIRNLLSVKEKPHLWHAFSVDYVEIKGYAVVIDAGYASSAIKNGQGEAKLVFGQEHSRFAAKNTRQAPAPYIDARVYLQQGELEVDVNKTMVINKDKVAKAVLALDKDPQNITKAWALASMARFLGMKDHVLYAEKKVASFNINNYTEFKRDVLNITPFELPR